jgi:chromosome partitioning protein
MKAEGLPLLDTYLSHSVKIRESHQRARPLINLDPNHKVARVFQALYDELNGKE